MLPESVMGSQELPDLPETQHPFLLGDDESTFVQTSESTLVPSSEDQSMTTTPLVDYESTSSEENEVLASVTTPRPETGLRSSPVPSTSGPPPPEFPQFAEPNPFTSPLSSIQGTPDTPDTRDM